MPFGNVNVDYVPCKSVGALKAAAEYMLGQQKQQLESSVKKTENELYTALGCNRENFANNILVTRKLNGKSYSNHKKNTILAHKMSISFLPLDKVDHRSAFEIAQDFAEHFIHSKGFEVLFAVHTDTDHVHAHFLISNCNMDTGKSYRRSQHDLYEMSEYFGTKCLEHGFTHSVRDNFYNHNMSRQKDKLTFGEAQMKKRGAESFKDELREVIRIEIADPNIGEQVQIRLTKDLVEVYFKGNRMTSHKRLEKYSIQPIVKPEHMTANHREYLNYNADEFKEWAATVGKSTEEVVKHFLNSGSVPEQGYKACVSLTKLGKRYGKKNLEAACERMLAFSSSPSIRTITTLLKNSKEPVKSVETTDESNKYGITRGAAYWKKGGAGK